MPQKVKRPIRIDGQVAYVPLTRGYEAIIDASDAARPEIKYFNWHALPLKGHVYAIRGEGGNKTIQMHRVILDAPAGLHVDHVSGDGLDNRRSNLRLATPSENMRNRRKHSNNTSGYKGVSWHAHNKKWRATIGHNGKQKTLGYYDTREKAHAAYCKASAELHGEFGRVT